MKKLLPLLALALASVALLACGGDDDDNGTTTAPTGEATNGAAGGGAAAGGGRAAGGQTISLEADPDGRLAYTTDMLSARAGTLTIAFDNPSAITHDVAVDDSGGSQVGKSDLIAEDSTNLVLQDLRPGTYLFYCTVPGHKEGGMEGTLTVR